MRVRIVTAVLGILAVLGLVALGGWFLTPAVFIVAVLSLLEYQKMMANIQIPVYTLPSAIALAVIIGSSGFYSLRIFLAAVILSFFLLLFLVLYAKKERMNSVIYTAFSVVYFGLGFGSLSLLRGCDELLMHVNLSIEPGVFLILFALIGTWASDSFAYLVGSRFGRYKMAPHISPNKTVEGLIGGIVGAVLLCIVLSMVVGFSTTEGFFMGLLVAIMAPVGDLFESYLKRACDVKDSGNILPGHGGMMDRFDSLLFAAPAVLIFLSLIR